MYTDPDRPDHSTTRSLVSCTVVIFTAVGLTGCLTSQQIPDREAVEQLVADLIAADNARDLESVLAVYADDALLLPPGRQPLSGKAAVRENYRTLFDNYQPEITLTAEEMVVADDWGYIRGVTGGRLIPMDGGEVTVLSDKFLMIVTRQPDQSWKVARLIWNRTP